MRKRGRQAARKRKVRQFLSLSKIAIFCCFVVFTLCMAKSFYGNPNTEETQIVLASTEIQTTSSMDIPTADSTEQTDAAEVETQKAETQTQVTETQSQIAEEEESIQNEATTLAQQETFIIDNVPNVYLYSDMLKDKDALLKCYPDLLSVKSLATTADQRQVWLFRIGSANAAKKVLIHGGIHAREYITCQLTMQQMIEFLRALKAGESFSGYSLVKLMEDTAVYFIPMVNPDGVSISQLGLDGIQTEETLERLKKIAAADGDSLSNTTYLKRWKANARGIDLNRNFDALWESYAGSGHISSDHFKGEKIGSEAESSALISLTNEEMFDRTISYHTQGSVVYWYFAQAEPLKTATYTFAKRMGATTGYPLDANYQSLDPAGYKDWCVHKMDIPSITIEVGTETSPVPSSQYSKIWKENKSVVLESLVDLIENPYKPTNHEQMSTPDTPEFSPASDAASTSMSGKTYTVVKCKEFINMRNKADVSATVIFEIPLGADVIYRGEGNNGFYLVEYKGNTGYVRSDYLKIKE